MLLSGCAVTDAASDGAPSSATASTSAALERLERETGARWTVVMHAQLGTPEHLSAASNVRIADGVTASQTVVSFLAKHKDVFRMTDPASELEPMREERDELGMTHARFRQIVRGVPVMGGELYAHFDRTGALASIDARWVPGLDAITTTAAIDADAAIARATSDLANDIPSSAMTWSHAPMATPIVFADGARAPRLAYRVQLRVGGWWTAKMEYAIDATSGEVLSKYDDIETVTGTGAGVMGDTKTLQIAASGGGYQLVDGSRTPNGISTYDCAQSQTTPGTLFTSATSSSWDTGVTGAGAAVDAHYYAGIVYDYYKTHHARLGIDGNNGAIVSSVHFQSRYDNAFWDGTQMVYGDGDGTQFRAFSASLDVVGHELTHGVTQNTSGLVYSKQSGALNEAVSDIFGTFVEHAAQPDPVKNWQLGEGLSLTNHPFRDMIHPANGMQPAHMSQLVNTTQDNGGVHTNSGIVNNAMYLMTMGGTNDVSHTVVPRGIGWDRSAQLWYRAAFHYFTSTTDFAGAARGTLTAATDLTFTTDEAAIVECAWIATGVVTGTCKPLGTTPPTQTDAGTPPPRADGGSDPPPQPPTQGGGDAGTADPGPTPPATTDGGTSSPRWHGFTPTNANASCSVESVGTSGGANGAAGVLAAAALIAMRRRKSARAEAQAK